MTEKLFCYVFDSECPNVTLDVTKINQLCVSDYYQYSIIYDFLKVYMLERGVCELVHSFFPFLNIKYWYIR